MATPIPENTAPFSLDEVVQATRGEARAGSSYQFAGVSTDSRADLRGKLFVALPGERFDGHDFVPQALAGGAAGVVLSRDLEVAAAVSVVRVPSTLDALGRLAAWHRKRWAGRLIAVGGSAGKTTTRTAIAAALEAAFPNAVHAARGNLNNRVGLPMVLFGISPEHRIAVVEVGTNVRGEVAQLAALCEPDAAVLTSIGVEHAEGIGDLDAIELEEGDLLRALGPAGVAIANGDDPRCRRQLQQSPAQSRLAYGVNHTDDYRLVERSPAGAAATRYVIRSASGRTLELRVPLLGLPGAYATMAACAVAERFSERELAAERLEMALGRAVFEAGRLVPLELGDGTLVLDDTYNSNPISLRSSLATAREIARHRGVRLLLVLGEMRELGPLAQPEHAQIGRELSEIGPAELIGISGDAELFVEACKSSGIPAWFAQDSDVGAELAAERVTAGDVVLVKASRGVRAERVVNRLVSQRGTRD